uniref:Tuberin N-terminal domain-containing protein n=1 Tax=Timema bartmani TaxID=61472 RepID=A0A7R9EUF3_9NEOP|nr:unnamed protein product [Timema bartmani]
MFNAKPKSAVEKLWACLKDLFHPDIAKEHRHLAFTFFSCLVQGQYEKLGIMRSHFFRLIKTHDVAEDVAPRFELLQSLTENGKDIKYFEEEVGPFLMQWMPAITGVGKTQQFLAVWVNVIKFNAAYVDEEVIKELVQNTCFLCCWSNSQPVVLTCLQVLDTVVCYTNLPSQSITTFIIALYNAQPSRNSLGPFSPVYHVSYPSRHLLPNTMSIYSEGLCSTSIWHSGGPRG